MSIFHYVNRILSISIIAGVAIMSFVGCKGDYHALPQFEGEDLRYVRGKVIIKAEKDHPVGMIKLIDLYKESGMEMPSRAVMYTFGDSENIFDLNQTVAFTIAEKGDLQIAQNIVADRTDVPMLSLQDRFELSKELHLNLHNGDMHREGPKHKRIHIIIINGGALRDPLFYPQYPDYTKVYHVDYEMYLRSEFDVSDYENGDNRSDLDSTVVKTADLLAATGDSHFVGYLETVMLGVNPVDVHSLTIDHIH